MLKPDALAGLMASDTPHAVLDVRERGAFERGHVFRTTTLPRRQLEFRVPGLVTAPATPIALIDADGALAPLAATTLGAMGYRDVRVLDGGLAAWRAAGRRVVQGLNVPSKVFGERALHEWGTPQIAPHELMRRIDKRDDLVIVDSRTFEEYHRGCIPGSISVPGGELVFRIGELVERPETTIVVHCGGRTRSYIGAESLRRMRLPNPIVALENGTMGWELAGLTLERGANRTAPAPGSKSHVQAAATAKRVAAEDGVRSLGVDDVRRLWDARRERNVYLVDVRTADEYEADHVAGSIWAPGGQAVQATDDYFAVRGASYVFICDGFVRSVMTAAWFTRMGVPDVAVLAGGVSAWRDGGGLIESGQPAPPRGPRPSRTAPARAGRGSALPQARRPRRRARGRRRHERRVRARPRARRRLDLPQPARVEDPGRGAGPHAADRPHVRGRRRLHARRGDARGPRLQGGQRARGRHARVDGRRPSARRGHDSRLGRGRRRRAQTLPARPRGDGGVPEVGGGARSRR